MKCIKQPIFALGLLVLSSLPILVQGQVRIRQGADRVIGEITPESVSSPESERRKVDVTICISSGTLTLETSWNIFLFRCRFP